MSTSTGPRTTSSRHGTTGRVLITGGAGQLARDITEAFRAADWEVDAPTRVQLDVTNRRAVLGFVEARRPRAIVNAAAWTNPQGCEDEPLRAWTLHAMAVRHLAEASRASGAHLCQISTDYVFDGSPGHSHDEWDTPVPTSVYGRSKFAGESEVPDGATVIRTSRLVGAHGNNVGRNVLRLARRSPDQRFGFDTHHKGCVTFTTDLAAVIERLVAERLPGMYHVTNPGVVTWYEFARTVLAAAGEDPDRVGAVDASRADVAITRPEYSVLENVALRAAGLDVLPPWQDSVGRFVASLSD